MNKKQTAVEQFAITLYEKGLLTGNGDDMQELLNKAKEMEKKQIMEAANYGCDEWMSLEDRYRQGELYYKETYE